MTYTIVNKQNKTLFTFNPEVPEYRNPFKFGTKLFTVYPTRQDALVKLNTIRKELGQKRYSDRTYKIANGLFINERLGEDITTQ